MQLVRLKGFAQKLNPAVHFLVINGMFLLTNWKQNIIIKLH